MIKLRRKLIEVALPLEAVNSASSREKSIRHGHPSTIHLWWARRPLAAARAVLFAQLVDDPSSHPDLFPSEAAQEAERQRLFQILDDLVQWENSGNKAVLESALAEIRRSWQVACIDNASHPDASNLFRLEMLPSFHDPFAGGGAIPLEAQRLGLESYATDLNPVAVLINKSMIEVPCILGGRPPINPAARETRELTLTDSWPAASGLAADVSFYGHWMAEEAARRVGRFYPDVEVTNSLVAGRRDLAPLVGRRLQPMAWVWARTVRSPDPAFAQVHVPLVSSFVLSSKKGKEVCVWPRVSGEKYEFEVRFGPSQDFDTATDGTRLGRGGNFKCVLSGTPISAEYIRAEGREGRLGSRLLAIVAEGEKGRIYLAPLPRHEALAASAQPSWAPDTEFFQQALGFRVGAYGFTKWSDLFSKRQLAALSAFSDLVREARAKAKEDAVKAGLADDSQWLSRGGTGAEAYADAVALYLAFAVDKLADRNSTLCGWASLREHARNTFGRQAVSFVSDYAECNPFSSSSGNFLGGITSIVNALGALPAAPPGHASQADAASQVVSRGKIVSTDPPYYDNIGYADLSDFFYVWLRKSLSPSVAEVFDTVTVPKQAELVATPARHGGKRSAEEFFLAGMTTAMKRIAEAAHPAFPVTVYYAFKQAETEAEGGSASTGWETFLDACIRSGLSISGTWPVRTELGRRMRGMESNALASSIVLCCRPRPEDAPTVSRREFVSTLNKELATAVERLQWGAIAPVDLQQAAIGPGMAVFTRYAAVLDADGKKMSVRDALTAINNALAEVLVAQEGDFDADSRWALAWFDQFGFSEGEYGVAETLSKAKNTSVRGLEEAGILRSSRGKVRLLKPHELPPDWDPITDPRLTAWEVVHHLIRALDASGELGGAALVTGLGAKAEVARELAYRLFALCERKRRAPEALAYNGLVQSWPEISRLARKGGKARKATQTGLFDKDEE